MRIAVTDCGREEKQRIYIDWLRSHRPAVEFVTVSFRDADAGLSGCSGLVLTGGEDVDPALSHAAPIALVEEIDRRRDDFEFAMLRLAQSASVPVLGICRGLQVANVFFGGTLIADLPAAGYRRHSPAVKGEDLRHSVTVTEGSMLQRVTGALQGEVNSFHHQAVLSAAEPLTVTARSADNVAEAMEWKEPEGKPFLLLVQWHPERMKDRGNPFTNAVAEAFFTGTEQYQSKH